MHKQSRPDVTRRRFLPNSLIAGAAASGCPSPASETAPGANDQIVVGIIGMGIRGTQLVTNIPATGRVAAICDADTRKTDQALTGGLKDLS